MVVPGGNQEDQQPLIEEGQQQQQQQEGQGDHAVDMAEEERDLSCWEMVECILDRLLDNSIWIMILFPILMVLSKVAFCPDETPANNSTDSSTSTTPEGETEFKPRDFETVYNEIMECKPMAGVIGVFITFAGVIILYGVFKFFQIFALLIIETHTPKPRVKKD